MLFLLALFAVTLIGLGRSVLIMLGLYKDPLLRTFEQYGPSERLPLPALTLVAWSGAFVTALSFWLPLYLGAGYPITVLGLVIMGAAGWGFWNYNLVARWHYRFIPYPRWHHELRERTTRYERRRIAYMWLHLPLKLRLTYNSSDTLFFNWADFVIMGTIREEEEDIFDERFYTQTVGR